MAPRQPTPVTETPLAELNAHIAQLIATDRALLAEQIDLEKRDIAPELPKAGPAVTDRLRHFLNGFASTRPGVGMTAGERLNEIHIDRASIKLALSDLEQKRCVKEAAEGQAIAAADTPDWLVLVRNTVLARERLKALEAKMMERRQGPGGAWLPHVDLVGQRSIAEIAWNHDPGSRVVRELVARGVVTEAQLKEAARV
jgi:hypothetical protein